MASDITVSGWANAQTHLPGRFSETVYTTYQCNQTPSYPDWRIAVQAKRLRHNYSLRSERRPQTHGSESVGLHHASMLLPAIELPVVSVEDADRLLRETGVKGDRSSIGRMPRTQPLAATVSSSTSTTGMEASTSDIRLEALSIGKALKSVVTGLSDENYAESFAFYRVWFDVGHAYHNITSDRIFRDIRENKGGGSVVDPISALTHSNAHLIVRAPHPVQTSGCHT